MKILKKEKKLCISCMNEHEVLTIELEEKSTFKDVLVTYPAVYEYCPVTDECWENEEMMKANWLTLREAYSK